MAGQYDDNMRGVLFRNEDKKSEKHPDYKGNGEVNGVEVWLSAWVKTSKKGTRYLSLAFENKQGKRVEADVPISTDDLISAAPVTAVDPTLDDDIPF